ncbi:unnamed protein product [Albugo candida]|uniref:RxLR effector protein n=1 Tax=Albugo candida TaxID=65357 RepID=A0A024GMI8_9STRA|nr:unnamed protein product [Albugo candida]|eukprot:CCI47752.1 unnamed protein product [Albugo candida]
MTIVSLILLTATSPLYRALHFRKFTPIFTECDVSSVRIHFQIHSQLKMRKTAIILLVASFCVSQYSCEELSGRELTTSPRFRKLEDSPEQGTVGGPGAISKHPSQRYLSSAVVGIADDNAKDDRESSKEKDNKKNREEEKPKGHKGLKGGKK